VVEQLGHCAVSLRRTSANRPRGWSTETASTSEEVVIIEGNNVRLAHPERQPHGPPGEHEAQKDEGFARFLKKHSSPTHNRVTAGGRIVPMEKRETPPKFDLGQLAPASSILLDPSKQAGLPLGTEYGSNFPSMNGANGFRADFSHRVRSWAEENPLEHDINASNVANHDSSQKTTALSGRVPAQPESFPNPVPIQHQPLQQRGPLPIWPNQFLPQMNPSAYPGMIYPELTWLYPQPVVLPEAEPSVPAAYEPETQSMTMSQHCLYHSRMLYGRLEEQLRGIDRRRAQGAHNPELSQQRLTIAQHRDEARTLIKNLEAHVAMEQQLAHLQGAMVFSAPLNVRAPSYVPQRAGPASRTTDSTPLTSKPPESWMTTNKTHSGAKRKPIPIMPPPDRSPISSPNQDMSDVHKQNKLEEGTKKDRLEYPVFQNGDAVSALQLEKQEDQEEEVGTKSIAELGGEADEEIDADPATVQDVQNWSDARETSARLACSKVPEKP
jgi:hypothetical protein